MYRRNNLAYRIIDSFFRHRWVFLIAVLATTGLVYGVMLFRSQGYVANAALFINTEKDLNKVLGAGDTNPWANPAADNVQHLGNLMRDDLPGGFIETFLAGAQLRQPIRVDPEAKDKRLADLKDGLTARPEGKEVMIIQLRWPEKRECERLLRAIQTAYIDEAGASRQARSSQTANFLDGQIKAYTQRMRMAENALAKYRTDHFGQMPAAQQSLIERLSQLKQELDYLTITTGDADKKIQFIENRIGKMNPDVVLERTLGKSANASMIEQLVVQRRAAIASGYRPDSTTVKDLNNQIRSYTGYLQQESKQIGTAGAGVMTNIQGAKVGNNPAFDDAQQQLNDARIVAATQKERMKLLKESIARYEKAVRNLPQAEKELTERTRDYETISKHMQDMLNRQESMRLQANVDRLNGTSGLQPLGRVTATSTNSAAKNLTLLAGSLLLGLIAGAIVVVGREWLDPTVRYEPDIERAFGVPVLAGLLDSREILALPEGDRKRPSRPVLPMPPAA